MTDNGLSLGIELIREIARQDMIKAEPKRDAEGRPTGFFIFKWAGNADEQLEAHLWHLLARRGLMIARRPQGVMQNPPSQP